MCTISASPDKRELEQGKTLSPRYNDDGLITAVVQDCATGDILMLAHMNAEALEKTITTSKAHFWSRSRQSLWMKGETSGNILTVREACIDCDQDAIVLRVDLAGSGACHTGEYSCFYRKIVADNDEVLLKRV